MTATVRRYNLEQNPELWWTCAICKASQIAKRTTAIVDSQRVSPDALDTLMNEGGFEGTMAVDIGDQGDLSGLAEGVRDMLGSDD